MHEIHQLAGPRLRSRDGRERLPNEDVGGTVVRMLVLRVRVHDDRRFELAQDPLELAADVVSTVSNAPNHLLSERRAESIGVWRFERALLSRKVLRREQAETLVWKAEK